MKSTADKNVPDDNVCHDNMPAPGGELEISINLGPKKNVSTKPDCVTPKQSVMNIQLTKSTSTIYILTAIE